jgi:hypothetical protein
LSLEGDVALRSTKQPTLALGQVGRLVLAGSIVLGCMSPAGAEVVLSFYSHDLGHYRGDVAFYHAFFTLSGTTQSDKKPVRANFGFTASRVTPEILVKSVAGEIKSMPDDYIRTSRKHLSMPLTDRQYRSVMSVLSRWQHYPQPSYHLDRHNCVTFARDVALALHLPVSSDTGTLHSPRQFLDDLRTRTYAQAKHTTLHPQRSAHSKGAKSVGIVRNSSR